ncbi:MAG: hypothetical protein KatS3mg105_3694 [Gemmatales bacterium]|nr:MAG: hypothetical protein KatS3mg105_3694 [Gemmatales bacterium]
MVFAVQCPNPKCRKFMLVEERDRNKTIACLLCKYPIKVGSDQVSKKPEVKEQSQPPKNQKT